MYKQLPWLGAGGLSVEKELEAGSSCRHGEMGCLELRSGIAAPVSPGKELRALVLICLVVMYDLL